jgi:hypothetical protein
VLEGEAVLTTGRIWVAAQALGGLHDALLLGGILEALPSSIREPLLAHASTLSRVSFCQELSHARHVQEYESNLAVLPVAQQQALRALDQTRNIDPHVVRCEASGEVVIFHKEATVQLGRMTNRQHLYGAVRFLAPPCSSFQFIRIANDPPSEELLQTMIAVVNSFGYQ